MAPSSQTLTLLLALLLGPALARRTVGPNNDMEVENLMDKQPEMGEMRILTQDEVALRDMKRASLLSLAEAEKHFNAKLDRAIAMANDAGPAKTADKPQCQVQAQPEEGTNTSTIEEDITELTKKKDGDLPEAMEEVESDFREEMSNLKARGMKPNVQAYICMQLDIDLSTITIPGLSVNIGLLGGVSLDFKNNCWGASFEASLGIDWGFKVLGFEVGMGAAVTGLLDLSEVPPERAISDPESLTQNPAIYAPHGSNLKKCHSKSPWIVIQTFIEHSYRRIYSYREVRRAQDSLISNATYTAWEEEFMKKYGERLNGDIEAVKLAGGKYVAQPVVDKVDEVLKHAPPQWPEWSQSPTLKMLGGDSLAENARAAPQTPKTSAQVPLQEFQRSLGTDSSFMERNPEAETASPGANKKAIYAPTLSGPAVAMNKAMRLFVQRLPPYASQIMGRLVDGQHRFWGPDNERSLLFKSRSEKRFHASTGRYMARWPSLEDFSALHSKDDVPEMAGEAGQDDDAADVEAPTGMSSHRRMGDQRVISFVKTMRLSDHRNELYFWKELAMSAGNLLVRTVADVKALFSAAFAEDPNWDGHCASLKTSFNIGAHKGARLETALEEYPFGSGSTQPRKRAAFGRETEDSHGRPHARALEGTPNWQVRGDGKEKEDEPELYPHLWCTLAEKAPRDDELGMGGELGHFSEAQDALNLFVAQSCETVLHQELDLQPDDTIARNNDTNYFEVTRADVNLGVLAKDDLLIQHGMVEYDIANIVAAECKTLSCVWPREAVEEAVKLGYRLSKKVVDTRPECERAVLPTSFVRMFPRFMYTVQEYMARMEEHLLSINVCLDEAHNVEKLEAYVERHVDEFQRGDCIVREEKLAHVKAKAEEAVRLVRMLMIRLGAEDPRTNQNLPFRDETLPLSDVEKSLLDRAKTPKHFAPTAHLLALDYVEAFGVGPYNEIHRNDKKIAHILEDVNRFAFGTPDKFRLEGRFWMDIQNLKPELQQIADPLNRIAKDSAGGRLRPAVEWSSGWSITAQLSKNGFCTPNTGLLMVSYVKQTTRQTWSTRASSESCFIGRARPGDTFVQVMRCSGNLGGQYGDFSKYTDWRVRFQGTLIKGNILDPRESGILGNIATLGSGALSAAAMSAGGVAGGLISGAMVEKFSPYVLNSTIAGTLLGMSASAAPLLGVVGAGALFSMGTFKETVKHFLGHLSQHGVVTPSVGMSAAPWTIDVIVVAWGALIHRQKEVHLHAGPAWRSKHAKSETGLHTVMKTQKFSTLHVENWNRARLKLPIPAVGAIGIFAKLEFDWDLTSVVEAYNNKKLFEKNKERIRKCSMCLQDGMGFCDWRVPLGSLWKPKYDVCVPLEQSAGEKHTIVRVPTLTEDSINRSFAEPVDETATPKQQCKQHIGVFDDVGARVHALWYDPKDGIESCDDIDFVRYNKEFRMSGVARRFFRRH